MKSIRLYQAVLLLFGLSISFFITKSVTAGNNIITGELRVDLPVISTARGYQVLLSANALPLASGGYTTNWLSVDDGPNQTGFFQVGLIAFQDGVRWFAYSDTYGVSCIRGYSNPNWGTCGDNDLPCGCIGYAGDIIDDPDWYLQWYRVELLNQGTYWVARVYDTDSVPYDVAKI